MLDISTQAEIFDLNISNLTSVIEQVIADKNIDRPIACILTDDGYIQELNKTYRNIDAATDVLSFELADPIHPAQSYLGEIYISVERARQQARDHNRPLQIEVTHLAIHGVLHLLGFEHTTQSGYEQMLEEEKKYLALQ